jgi:hypothetical protein
MKAWGNLSQCSDYVQSHDLHPHPYAWCRLSEKQLEVMQRDRALRETCSFSGDAQ